MKTPDDRDPAERIADLETELKERDARIKRLTSERDEALELVGRMREHIEDHDRLIESWIEVFEMQQDDRGVWLFDTDHSALWEQYDALLTAHRKLIRQWNKFIGEYNAVVSPRERGRPLAASPAQQKDIAKRRKAGESLRQIAGVTALSLQSVRTIVEKAAGQGRPSKRTNELRRLEFDRRRAAAYRVRKKGRDRLPQQITEHLKTGAALNKAAKGL